jgi:hypothetical protein
MGLLISRSVLPIVWASGHLGTWALLISSLRCRSSDDANVALLQLKILSCSHRSPHASDKEVHNVMGTKECLDNGHC